MNIKTNDSGSSGCTTNLGCRYNNIKSHNPKMRRCKIKKNYLENVGGYLYTFSDNENEIYPVNLKYLINNWHIIIRRVLCGTLGSINSDKYFHSNYLIRYRCYFIRGVN